MSLSSKYSLKGKVALVTGAGRGIGKAISLGFAEAGADVVVCSRTSEQLEVATEEIRRLGPRTLAISTDITKKKDVDNLVQKTINEFGKIDILVNNAGTSVQLSMVDHEEDDWDLVMNTNLKGYYLCSRAVGKKMIEQRSGNIISISSVRGLQAFPGRASYCVSKAGVIMLTKVMAVELVGYNIRANSIAPGFFKTEFTMPSWEVPEKRQKITAAIPMGRWGEMDEIASTALFLASDASSYMTGHTLVVSGGMACDAY